MDMRQYALGVLLHVGMGFSLAEHSANERPILASRRTSKCKNFFFFFAFSNTPEWVFRWPSPRLTKDQFRRLGEHQNVKTSHEKNIIFHRVSGISILPSTCISIMDHDVLG
jgi:hypothetical protein